MDAADSLRELRERHGLTQKDVARICATTERTVQRWEGRPGAPSSRTMPAMAWRLLQAAVGEQRARVPRPPRKRPAKPRARPPAATPPKPIPAPHATPGEAPRAQLGLPVSKLSSKKLDEAELARLKRLAQASK